MDVFKKWDRVREQIAKMIEKELPGWNLQSIECSDPEGRTSWKRKLKPRAPRLRGWVSVYPSGGGFFYASKEDAEAEKSPGQRLVEVVEVRKKK